MKTAAEIRSEFLDFFKRKDHCIVPSSPLIPQNDPTLLFINAGMNQFKDVFLGTGKRSYVKVADTQKCIRVSGKHNDLEEVGRDTYHHTFFEMLGNWSFGDYFKKDAIKWAWELLHGIWQIPREAIWVTVFGGDERENLPGDDEAAQVWINEAGIAPERVLRFGKKDNFWEMGETGPCGPCSEIHVDMDVLYGRTDKILERGALVNAGNPSVIEIWNLVFIQFNRQEDGRLAPLPQKHVDTGMGLERVTMVLQGKDSNYDTDLFTPILDQIVTITGKKYTKTLELSDIAFRVIADHVRALSAAFADGALPSNSKRGYVLRRLLRRAARYGRQVLGMEEPFIYKLVPVVAEIFRDVFPEIDKRKDHIALLIRSEEESFNRMLARGIQIFGELVREVKQSGTNVISGEKAYQLFHQDGFPRDLVDLMAKEEGMTVDDTGWQKAQEQHKERSVGMKPNYEVVPSELEGVRATRWIGHFRFESNARIVKLIGNDKLVLDQTPFYAEGGGQVGDTGIISGNKFKFVVHDTLKFGDIYVHFGEMELGDLSHLPTRATAYVDRERRRNIMANHTATHLLHWALRKVLGEHAVQQGSLVVPDHLRFDVAHPNKITQEELLKIEQMVNELIYDNIPVRKTIESFEIAKKKGAMALFGEKYGDMVRVVSVGRYSKELCGGTHVYATGDLGFFQIVSESAVQTGVRRIEAITRGTAVARAQQQRRIVEEIKCCLKVSEDEMLIKRILGMQEEIKKIKKEEKQHSQRDNSQLRDDLLKKAPCISGAKIVVAEVESTPSGELRVLADLLRKASEPALGFLASRFEDKVFVVAFVAEKLLPDCFIKAGDLIKIAAPLIGGGGDTRRAEFAQGQGPDASQIAKVLTTISDTIKEKLSAPKDSL